MCWVDLDINLTLQILIPIVHIPVTKVQEFVIATGILMEIVKTAIIYNQRCK